MDSFIPTSPQPDPTSNPPVPIVAIGASAGGIEAVTELLKHLSPATGLAYVYVQHLDATADSQLSSILGRATAMPVEEARHELTIEPNHVYTMPGGHDMEVIDGKLMLMPRVTQGQTHMPIDQFFVSLAQRQQEASIGVILSGMADDGTLGLRAIKAAGGVTFAQDESARFQSMPKTAIANNVVDKVLSPQDIARELEALSRQADVFRQTAQALELTSQEADDEPETIDEDIKIIIGILRRSVGVDFTHYKMTTIRRRIIRRMLLFKYETLPDYIAYLKKHPEEMGQLYNDLLINVTTFFRDQDTMDYLYKVLLPGIIREKTPREPIRIWVPACSTGQEAYSLAIMLLELLGDRATAFTIQIFATDLSENAVAKARLGSYTRSEVIDMAPRRLQRFFTKVDDQYRIIRTIRDMCVFAPQNVLRDPPFSRLDLISCRNLLIYFDAIFQRRVIGTFHYALNPNGLLVLGKSETVGNMTTHFTQVEKNVKVFVRRNDINARPSFEMNFRSGLDNSGPSRPDRNELLPQDATMQADPVGRRAKTISVNDMEKIVDDLLLRQYVPASVVVNEELDILQFRGSTSLFLEPAQGRASLNLLKMARPSLVFELRNTLLKARKAGQPVRKTDLEVKVNDTVHPVAIEVVPLKTDTGDNVYLILFQEAIPVVTTGGDTAETRSRRIKQLEDELATLREDMRSIIEEQDASTEELQSANEEIISSNEELQSINEELETSKEEIESTNEELLTINQELQVRNDQLSEANEFSEVIFATIREATLVLDGDLRVISANKTFYRLFQVDENETEGRMIYELGNRQWDIPQLRTLLGDVVQKNVQVDSYEVRHTFADIGEKVLMLNARRVVRQREAILLAIEDITDHRRAQRLIAEREAFLHDLVDNAPVLMWVAGANGQYTFFNKAWLEYTGDTLTDATRLGWEHDIHPDDRESYLIVYNSSFAQRQPFQMESRLKRHDGEYRWMLVNATPSFSPGGGFTGYIGTCAELYNRKNLLQALDIRAQQRIQQVLGINANVLRAQRELARPDLDATQRKQARQKLKQNEDELRSLIDNVPDPITRWDTDLRLVYANSAYEKKMGVAVGDLLRKTNREMGQMEEIAGPYMDKLRQVIDTGQTRNHYNSYPTPQGLAYFYSTLVPELGVDGRAKTVLAIARDISDLKLVEDIQQTATNLQTVLDNSPAAIGLFRTVRDIKLNVVDFQLMVCNQRFGTLLQQPVDELTGQSILQLANTLWQTDVFPDLLKVLSTGEPVYLEQQIGQTNTWTGMSINRQGDGVVLTGLDITVLKQAEQQRLLRLNELEKSQENVTALEEIRRHVRERGEFLRTTTHDLRGSFGVIQGAAALMDMMDSEEERGQMLAMLQRNLRQMTNLLTDLLDYARLEAGQEQVLLTTFDAAQTLRDLAESMKPLANERGLQLTITGPDALPVESDAVKVQRIVQNLLLNALYYTPAGRVTITWGPDEAAGRWRFSVQDTGPGLDPALVRMLTDPAATAGEQPATVASASGEGVGLFIVRQLCRLLHAQLTVDSTPGEGTTFRISLPGHP